MKAVSVWHKNMNVQISINVLQAANIIQLNVANFQYITIKKKVKFHTGTFVQSMIFFFHNHFIYGIILKSVIY